VPARDGITTDVVRALDSAGIDVTAIAVRRPSLDDVFLALTGRQGAGDQAGASHGGEAA
jgi:ABC-2 type transport system ATP-binding protein